MNLLASAVTRCECTATEYMNGGQQINAVSTGIKYGCRLSSPPVPNDISPSIIKRKKAGK